MSGPCSNRKILIFVSRSGRSAALEASKSPFAEEDVRSVLDINYYKLKCITKVFVDHEAIKENGKIFNISSE